MISCDHCAFKHINRHRNTTRGFVFFAVLVSLNQDQGAGGLGVDLTVCGCNSSLMGKVQKLLQYFYSGTTQTAKSMRMEYMSIFYVLKIM